MVDTDWEGAGGETLGIGNVLYIELCCSYKDTHKHNIYYNLGFKTLI